MLPTDRVWYVAYGSNTSTERLMLYLEGGRLGPRTYPGARDPRPPQLSRRATIRGQIVFSGRSLVWGGGVAYLDPDAPGTVAAVAHLVTVAQLADIVAQECGADPGTDLDLAAVVATRRACVADHPYGTIIHLGDDDGIPMVTFTCGDPGTLSPTEPTAEYLAVIAGGLRVHHGADLAEDGAPIGAVGIGATGEPGEDSSSKSDSDAGRSDAPSLPVARVGSARGPSALSPDALPVAPLRSARAPSALSPDALDLGSSWPWGQPAERRPARAPSPDRLDLPSPVG